MYSNGHTTHSVPVSDKSLKLSDIFIIFFQRRLLITVLFFLIFSTTVVITFLMPKIYVASAKLLIKKGRAEMIVSANDAVNTTVKARITEQILNSEVEIMKSTFLLREVVLGIHSHWQFQFLAHRQYPADRGTCPGSFRRR